MHVPGGAIDGGTATVPTNPRTEAGIIRRAHADALVVDDKMAGGWTDGASE